MSIHNRENLHTLAAFREAHGVAPAFGCGKCGIDETLALIDRAFVPQRIGPLREDLAQHLPLTPLLEPTVDRFVIRIALRQEMPLGPGVQNPEHRLRTARVGMGLRPGRESGVCSSGKCLRIRSHWSSRSRNMPALRQIGIQAVNYFEIGSNATSWSSSGWTTGGAYLPRHQLVDFLGVNFD